LQPGGFSSYAACVDTAGSAAGTAPEIAVARSGPLQWLCDEFLPADWFM